MGASRKRGRASGAAPKTADERELEVLFPHIDVELGTGEKIAVRQWDIDTGAVLMPRVISMMQKLQGLAGEIELDELILRAKTECFQIVAGTIGWEIEKLRTRCTFEDFLSLLQAVIDTSLVRSDGSGALPKIVGLANALGPLAGVQAITRQSPEPSTSSSDTDIPSPISGE